MSGAVDFPDHTPVSGQLALFADADSERQVDAELDRASRSGDEHAVAGGRVMRRGWRDSSRVAITVGDRHEAHRFDRYVVRGDRSTDCWIWTGAIADDGYGRFWIRRDGRDRVVRANRYALALACGGLDEHTDALHWRCDNPVCVRAEAEGLTTTHIVGGTHTQNMASMAAKGRGGGVNIVERWYRDDKAARCARARALRAAVANGWDRDAVARALGATADADTLF